MKRLLRHLFTLGAATSLVLCIAVCVLWVRSYVVSDTLGRYCQVWNGDVGDYSGRGILAESGALVLFGFHRIGDGGRIDTFNRDGGWPQVTWNLIHEKPSGYPRFGQFPGYVGSSFLGFAVYSGSPKVPQSDIAVADDWLLVVPIWFIVVITAILPSDFIIRLVRRRRTNRAGLCPQCGYDRRAARTAARNAGRPHPRRGPH